MSNRPQQPEIARSRHTPIDQTERARQALSEQQAPTGEDAAEDAPEENKPGPSEGADQDKPDREAFRRRLAGEE